MRKTAVLLGVAICCAASAGTAVSGDHSLPGTPGQANCVGQTNAYFAQFSKTTDPTALPGIAGYLKYANANGVPTASVKDLQGTVKGYCASA